MIAFPALIFILWERTVADLLERTARFPKSLRFTFAQRVDNLAIDVLETLAEAQFARGGRKRELLAQADRLLLRLRVVRHLCQPRRLLDGGGYEHRVRPRRGRADARRLAGGDPGMIGRPQPILEAVSSFATLVAAAKRAARGKRLAPESARFLFDLEPEVLRLWRELRAETWQPGSFRTVIVAAREASHACRSPR